MAATVRLVQTLRASGTAIEPIARPVEETVRVVVFNDHPVFRSSLAWKVERNSGVRVVADVPSLYETLSLATETERSVPDAVVADMRIGDGNSEGVESIATLAKRLIGIPIIVTSDFCSRAYLARLIEAGAAAAVSKAAGTERLVDAIRQAVVEFRSNSRSSDHSAA